MNRNASLCLFASFLLMTLVLAGGCEKRISEYDKDQAKLAAAKDKLAAVGAKIEIKQFPQGDAFIVNLSGQTLTNETFGHIAELVRVVELDLSKSSFKDEDMALISNSDIRGVLMKLNLSDTALSDEGLQQLSEVYFLSELNAANTKITDAGISEFKTRWPNVKVKK